MKQEKRQGILFIIGAGFFFALMTFFVRLSGDLPTMEKAFFRNAVAAVVAAFLLIRAKEPFYAPKKSWGGLFMRSFCGTVGLICNFYAIDRLNIADANMLNKLSPFFAIIMSTFILKEKANKVEWGAVVLAFTGALLVIKPSFDIQFVYGLIGALGGLGAGIAYTYVRKLGKMGVKGPVIVLCFHSFPVLSHCRFFIIGYKPMSMTQFVCLMLAGVCAAGGQICITTAYTKAPAKAISVFDYTQIVFAALLGILFLNQIPDALSIAGYIVIIGTAIFKWQYNMKYDT